MAALIRHGITPAVADGQSLFSVLAALPAVIGNHRRQSSARIYRWGAGYINMLQVA
jgi:hypothetical protein